MTSFGRANPNGVIATGFIAAGPWDFVGHVELREGTVDKLKTRVLDRDDMVTNTMSTFQSVTVHCARCHDHKFDPIPQRDYYRLQAVFADIDRGDRQHTPDHKLVYAVLPVAPRPIHLLRRGEVEQPGELVQPGGSRAWPVSPANSTRLSTVTTKSHAPRWLTGLPVRRTCSRGGRSSIGSGIITLDAELSIPPTTSAAMGRSRRIPNFWTGLPSSSVTGANRSKPCTA